MPLLRYSYFKKIYGYECWWVPESVILNILENINDPTVIFKLIKNLNDAIANCSKFILKKLEHKIANIKGIIEFRKKIHPELNKKV